ncbi:Tim44/TimA family putative adaptor protein [Lacibacterium aquatile]|uniref:Tim44/TimA family putative adaptor protein n=1 Tax=Lacibacterium aquatile TaxID=1168082 RepID=A0ABW5DWM0_9PROT
MSLFVEILLFAVIAAFLLIRLLGVFGKRTGLEKQRPNPFERPEADQQTDQGNVTPFPSRTWQKDKETTVVVEEGPLSLAESVQRLQRVDPSFNEMQFLGGARAAFQMIVDAYAAGDKDALRPLLSPSVFNSFARGIDERGEPTPSPLLKVLAADLAEVTLEGSQAVVTVRFASEQAGEDDKPTEVTELWTFRRDTKSADPNWHLSATKTQAS